ncbi:hypothetical protein MSTO_03270 [Mycobacterium stomatepiae]|uniref:Uncharacterized protein n=1 Tax=Mycobacterium stomatepiae TaxID=470076 RepID=A0A7I7Q214_9MYCO|nr:hypothetical protein MSTO_03270 [Mycobacterium stomatepiae]
MREIFAQAGRRRTSPKGCGTTLAVAGRWPQFVLNTPNRVGATYQVGAVACNSELIGNYAMISLAIRAWGHTELTDLRHSGNGFGLRDRDDMRILKLGMVEYVDRHGFAGEAVPPCCAGTVAPQSIQASPTCTQTALGRMP